MQFIERALAPTPGSTPGPVLGTNQTLEGTAP